MNIYIVTVTKTVLAEDSPRPQTLKVYDETENCGQDPKEGLETKTDRLKTVERSVT
jgi:hypothetical protein